MVIDVYDALESVPLFNEDLESAPEDPPGVIELRKSVASADGLLIATPEYNQSVPGVVKNMVDWLSRSRSDEGLAGKPVAVIGASTGPWGTRISQTLLRQMLLSTQALVLPQPTLFVRHADSVFDEDGALLDEGTLETLRRVVASLQDWILLVSPSEDGARG
jgi:chromate reductase